MRFLRILVAIAVLVGGLAVTTSTDARRRANSRIRAVEEHEFQNAITAISARVVSSAPRCLGGRAIEIVQTATNVTYGRTTTDSAGNWVVEGLGPEDVVYRITLFASARCGGDTVAVELG